MKKTSTGLVAYAKYQVDKQNFYWYGCVGFRPSLSLLKQKQNQYPSYYPPQKWTMESFTSQILPDRLVFDCVGLIKAYVSAPTDDPSQPVPFDAKFDVSANGLFKLCTETGKVDTIPEIPGLIVWKSGHVGVYAGDGYVYEAQGHAVGCKKTVLKNRPFTHWGRLPESWITYDTPPKEETCTATLPLLKKGMTGQSVKSAQLLLNAAGYTLYPDGIFGNKTEEQTKAFQKAHGIGQDGMIGPKTWPALIG